MSTRTFNLFGRASHDAIISLTVNENPPVVRLIDHTVRNPFDSSEILIYQFATNVQAHGATKIKLQVLEGNIHLGQTRVRYPAIASQDPPVHGWVWIFQPILDPKFLVKINGVYFVRSDIDQSLTGEWHYDLDKNDVFEYAHLHYNGPNYWKVSHVDNIDQFCSIGIFSVTDRQFIPMFCYIRQPRHLETVQNIAQQIMNR